MIMLEEGEIDEEDLDIPISNSTNTNTNTIQEQIELNINVNSTYNQKLTSPKTTSPTGSDHSSTYSNTKKRSKSYRNKLNKRKKHSNKSDEENTNDSFYSTQDQDDRFAQTTTTITQSSWGAPISKNDLLNQQQQQQQSQQTKPVSLFDLFKNNSQIPENPIITEKENSKPLLKTPQIKLQPLLSLPTYNEPQKRKVLLPEPDESELTVSVESIEKKMEKKRKYAEIQKEKQKKEAEKQLLMKQKKEQIVCNFFLSGRCQKGDKCPFKHEAPKKYELCKFYSNGYCSKLDKCMFMHSDFPCKFYHRPNGQCLNASNCRFSHEPITNPQLKEAFEKYLKESGIDTITIQHTNIPQQPSKPALLATPIQFDSSIPSLMNLPLKSDITQNTQFKDVDERSLLQPQLLESGDVDLRSLSNQINPPVQTQETDFETVKKELIVKIMKVIADEDDGIFSQIPKQVLTDLLVKLLNTDEQENVNDQLTTDAILTLLNTLNSSCTNKSINNENNHKILIDLNENDDKSYLNESTSNLQIDLGFNKSSNRQDDYDQVDDNYVDNDDDDDDYEYENNLVIEGCIGEFDYKLIEIDIEPYSLWTNPPVDNTINNSLDSEHECDPRIKYYSNKSNRENVLNFHLKLQEQNMENIKQEKLVQTPTSPSSSSLSQSTTSTKQSTDPTAVSPIYQENTKQITSNIQNTKPVRVDPRLAARNMNTINQNNQSPNRSLSPTNLNDQLNIRKETSINNNNNNSSLLSSLPDFKYPQDLNKNLNNFSNINTVNYSNVDSSNTNVNKLSIEDYKRKLQKPNLNKQSNSTGSVLSNEFNLSLNSITNSIANSITNSSNSLNNSTNQQSSSSSSGQSLLPSIPSYTVNLQAPQSLHELLRNFQS